MAKATEIKLTAEEQKILKSWISKGTMEQRLVERAHIILGAAEGKTTTQIAQNLQKRPATISKWRTRFFRDRIAGLEDAPRPGKTAKYDKETEKRILAQLDAPAPVGYTSWTGKLVAKALGDVSQYQVWRVLRQTWYSPSTET